MPKRTTKSVTITARITPALNRKLEAYAKADNRTKSQALENILDEHLDYDAWFSREVRKGIESAEIFGAIPHEEVMRRLRAHIAKRKRERRKAA